MSSFDWSGRLASFRNALRGALQLRREPNARIGLVVAGAVVALGFWLEVERRGWALLVFAIGFVLVAEALNTALEALADRTAPDPHPLVAKAKDLAAGGVLLAAVVAAIVGLLVLGPPLLARLAG